MTTKLQLGVLAIGLAAGLGCDALIKDKPTITDESSPYYDRPCPLDQHREHPSDLIADCRCGTNQAPTQGIPLCQRPYNLHLEGFAVGEGPSYAGLFNTEYLGGFLDETEGPEGTLYVAVGFGGSTDRSGAVLAVDVATGDRRVVSGTWFNEAGPQEQGEGPIFETVLDVRPHPDGNLYAFVRTNLPTQQEIFRIDRVTGDRELVWKGRSDFPQCTTPEGVVQYTDNGFNIGEDGTFYLSHGTVGYGNGILRLAPDLSSCEVFSGESLTPELARGDGPGLGGNIMGFTLHDGQLVASGNAPKMFVTIDLETGDRRFLYEPQGVTPPERWSLWDEGRGVWWFAGFQNAVSIFAYDPETGVTASVFDGGVFPWMPLGAAGPVQINSLNYAPVWIRSNGNLLVAQDGFSIVEYEPHTGNSVIISL